MKLLSSLIGLIIAALALVFALSNRSGVPVSLWPFGAGIDIPLYLLSLGTLGLGFFLGVLVAWLAMLPHRFEARRLRKDIAGLHDKIADLQQTVIAPPRAPSLPTGEISKWKLWKSKA